MIEAAKMYLENRKIDELISDLKHPLESHELRFKINCDNFKDYGQNILKQLNEYVNQNGFSLANDNHEGIRISFNKNNGNGWCLLRQSLHDPIMPFNVESNDKNGCRQIAEKIYDFLKDFELLEIETLKQFIKQ